MDKLKQLLEVKKIIAIMLAIVFCMLALKGSISAEQFVTTFLVVIGFYFSQSSIRASIKENK